MSVNQVLEKVIIVRHGAFDEFGDRKLTDAGDKLPLKLPIKI